jgi:hypothetical protein
MFVEAATSPSRCDESSMLRETNTAQQYNGKSKKRKRQTLRKKKKYYT